MKVKLPDGTVVDVDPANIEGVITAEDLEKTRREAIEQARKEERDKLYPQQAKTKEQLDEMQAEVKRLQDAETARNKEAEKRAREVEAAKKAAEEAELSAKDLIARRDQEFQDQIKQIQAANQQAIADMQEQQRVRDEIFQKEREFQALQLYIRDSVAANQDKIAPELIDLIDGNTQAEVDASVARMVEKTAQIVAGMRQAAQSMRAGMPGVSPGGGTAGIVPGLDTGDKILTDADIKGMSMKEFGQLRQQVGLAGRGQGQGIFG